DAGKDNYAGTTWSNLGDGRTVFIGWMTNQRYSNLLPATTLRGCMTLPRELSLKRMRSGWRIIQQPLRELELLRNPPQAINEARITDKQPLHLGQINGAIELEVDLQITAAECGIRIS